MPKCDYKNCSEEATVNGRIYGHVSGTADKDKFSPVNACDKHRKIDGFFEDGELENSMH